MRAIQRHPALRLLCALIVSALLSAGLWQAGKFALLAGLFALLELVAFTALTIAPDAIAHWRKHPWRWWWRVSDDEGPFWPGTRIPRHR